MQESRYVFPKEAPELGFMAVQLPERLVETRVRSGGGGGVRTRTVDRIRTGGRTYQRQTLSPTTTNQTTGSTEQEQAKEQSATEQPATVEGPLDLKAIYNKHKTVIWVSGSVLGVLFLISLFK